MCLVFINDLLNDRACGKGAIIGDLRVNIPTQADDICLVSSKYVDLKDMLHVDLCSLQ